MTNLNSYILQGENALHSEKHPWRTATHEYRSFAVTRQSLPSHVNLLSYSNCALFLHLSVTSEREITRSHSTRAIKFSFSSSLELDVTRGSPLTQLALALVAN